METAIKVQLIASATMVVCALITAAGAIIAAGCKAKKEAGSAAQPTAAQLSPTPATDVAPPAPKSRRGVFGSMYLWIALLALILAASATTVLSTGYWLKQQTDLQRQHIQRLEQMQLDANSAILHLDDSGKPQANDAREAGWTRVTTESDRQGTMRTYRRTIKLPRVFARAPTIIPTVWGQATKGPWYIAIDRVKGHEATEFDLVVQVYPVGNKFDFDWMYISWMAFDTPEGPPPPWTPPSSR